MGLGILLQFASLAMMIGLAIVQLAFAVAFVLGSVRDDWVQAKWQNLERQTRGAILAGSGFALFVCGIGLCFQAWANAVSLLRLIGEW